MPARKVLCADLERNVARHELVTRWFELTRNVLPAMAADQHWPIRFDHCFMRVCLDATAGAPWTKSIARPAIAHLSDAQLVKAIEVAQGIADEPSRLPELNEQSLEGRRLNRRERSRPTAA